MAAQIPTSLRRWFVIHFVADMLFGLPLLFAPAWTLQLMGFAVGNLYTARLVGAALIGIGGTSLLVKNKGIQTYQAMLTLKILWSLSAIVGLFLSLLEQPVFFWLDDPCTLLSLFWSLDLL